MRLPVLRPRPPRPRTEPVDELKAASIAHMTPALTPRQRLELVGPMLHHRRIYYIGFIKSRSRFRQRRPPAALLVSCPSEGIVSEPETTRELLHGAILASVLFHDRSNLVKKMGGNNERIRSRLPAVRAALGADERLGKLTSKLDALEALVDRQDRVLERMFNIEGLFDRSSTPDTGLTNEWIELYHETVDLYEALVNAFEGIWGSEGNRRNLTTAFRTERHDSMSLHDIFIDLKMMRYTISQLQRLLDRAGFYVESYMDLWLPKLTSPH